MNNQINPFELEENSIDIKKYFFKILKFWWLFVITMLAAYFIAKHFNRKKERLYKLNTTISIQDTKNPLFASSTNIMFSWGQTNTQVENIKSILTSRTHNEKLVDSLNLYINYYRENTYRMIDMYKDAPFEITINKKHNQLINVPYKLTFNNGKVVISFNESDSKKFIFYNYGVHETGVFNSKTDFSKEYSLDNPIVSDYFNFTIKNKNILKKINGVYYIKLINYNNAVSKYRKIEVKSIMKGGSGINLIFEGSNKQKIADFLNTSIQVLGKDQKAQKIRYAVKTKEYIDNVFDNVSDSLKKIEKDLGKFKEKERIYDLSVEGQTFYGNLSSLDNDKLRIQGRIQYYKNLKSYLETHSSIDSSIPVPAIIGAEDQTIGSNVQELLKLHKEKEILAENVTSDYPKLKLLENRISSARAILNENISTLKSTLNVNLDNVNKQIGRFSRKLSALPRKEQGLIKYQRKYNLTESNYNYLLQKRYEAGTIIASNVSDIKVIDTAKDTGQSAIYPKPLIDYMIAGIIGLLLPLLFIIIRELLNNKIYTVEDIENKYKIPLLGVIGKNTAKDNLIVYRKPKSTTSEAFRALRSNLQFLFKDNKQKSKTIVVTSTISGEGKTFISMNIATVFAKSEKKTILLGYDLRKPKIFNDFGYDNNLGLSNYLVGDKELNEVLHHTKIDNLDLILSGPIPPNPSELIISNKADELIEILKETYDYIIIDTPPVGLVADSIELFKHADATIYVIRQGKTHRNMPKLINDKYKNGEVENISFVLNDFSDKKAGYGYGYGYGYGGYGSSSYGQGYHDNEDEKKSFLKRIFKK